MAFSFFLNCNRTFCKQSADTLIRYHVLLGIILVCTVYLCPTKRTRTLGLIALYEKCLFPSLRSVEKPDAFHFFFGIFFLRTLDCFWYYIIAVFMIRE